MLYIYILYHESHLSFVRACHFMPCLCDIFLVDFTIQNDWGSLILIINSHRFITRMPWAKCG